MPALGAGIHVLIEAHMKTWMAGTSPAMTIGKILSVLGRLRCATLCLLDKGTRYRRDQRVFGIEAGRV
jgi:hypothetical protein